VARTRPAWPGLLLIHASPGERRAALVRDGVLMELALERPGATDGVGDVHAGRVTALVPAMAGAFVALQDAEAFLPDTDGAAGLTEGGVLAVRVTRAAQGGKGPRVAACHGEDLAGSAQLRLLRRGPSAVDDLLAAYTAEPIVSGAFDDALEGEIETLGGPVAELAGGMRARFAATPAFTAIDLDSGAATAARAPKATAQMAANLAVLPGLVRQIVLRNFSGAILIDFAGIPSRKRRALAPALESALQADPLRPRLAGFSNLGFAEISRPRKRPPAGGDRGASSAFPAAGVAGGACGDQRVTS
jgi:Ribonuclease G/E